MSYEEYHADDIVISRLLDKIAWAADLNPTTVAKYVKEIRELLEATA